MSTQPWLLKVHHISVLAKWGNLTMLYPNSFLLYVCIHCHHIVLLHRDFYNSIIISPNVLFLQAGQITRCQRWAEQWGRCRQPVHTSQDSPVFLFWTNRISQLTVLPKFSFENKSRKLQYSSKVLMHRSLLYFSLIEQKLGNLSLV